MTDIKIINNGNDYQVIQASAIHDSLPIGYYELGYALPRGFYLTSQTAPKIPDKIFDLPENNIFTRMLYSYESSNRSVGILLSGIAGGGKTTHIKYFCDLTKKTVIYINDDFGDCQFVDFLNQPIFNDTVLVFDECEKTIPQDDTKIVKFLQLLDGVYANKFLIIVSVNDVLKLNRYLNNRPSRIRYTKNYKPLVSKQITEVCLHYFNTSSVLQDLGLDVNTLIADIIKEIDGKCEMTYDILITIIKEIMLFVPRGDSIKTIVSALNLSLESVYYTVYITLTNKITREVYSFMKRGLRYINQVEDYTVISADMQCSIARIIKMAVGSTKQVLEDEEIGNSVERCFDEAYSHMDSMDIDLFTKIPQSMADNNLPFKATLKYAFPSDVDEVYVIAVYLKRYNTNKDAF